MNTIRWLCFYFVLLQAALTLILTAIWFLGESSERRQRRRVEGARREVEKELRSSR